jgi:protein Tex
MGGMGWEVFCAKTSKKSVWYLEEAIRDGLDRLLLTILEREIRSDKKHRADEAAIKVFGENLKQFIITGPIKGMTVLGFWSCV